MGSHNYKFCRDAALHNYPLVRCEKTQISRPARIQKLFVCIKISFRFFFLLPNLIFSLKSFSWISFSIFFEEQHTASCLENASDRLKELYQSVENPNSINSDLGTELGM